MTVRSTFTRGPRSLSVLRIVGVAGTVAALVWAGPASASAAPGDASPGTTLANVEVSTSIALTGLTGSFTLTGIPGATVTGAGAVHMTVATNNLAGYAVTVESATATMVNTAAGNADAIAIALLTVKETSAATYGPMSSATPVTVHTQATRSAVGGDALSNDYQIAIPFVNEDTYTATLNYIATTL